MELDFRTLGRNIFFPDCTFENPDPSALAYQNLFNVAQSSNQGIPSHISPCINPLPDKNPSSPMKEDVMNVSQIHEKGLDFPSLNDQGNTKVQESDLEKCSQVSLMQSPVDLLMELEQPCALSPWRDAGIRQPKRRPRDARRVICCRRKRDSRAQGFLFVLQQMGLDSATLNVSHDSAPGCRLPWLEASISARYETQRAVYESFNSATYP